MSLWGTLLHICEKDRRLQRPFCLFSSEFPDNRHCILTLGEQQAGVAWETLTAQLIAFGQDLFFLGGGWVWDMVSLCSSGWLETHWIAQVVQEFSTELEMTLHWWAWDDLTLVAILLPHSVGCWHYSYKMSCLKGFTSLPRLNSILLSVFATFSLPFLSC